MESSLLIFLPALFLICTVQPLNTDKLLLLSFKNAMLTDPYSILQKWSLDDVSPCAWPGVGCFNLEPNGSTASFRVNSISLPRSQLSGSIPPSLGIIEHLAHLDLSHNNFSGSVPIGFNRAELLDLSFNLFEGVLPEESYGGNLRYLNLSYNKLSGAIPRQFVSGVGAYATVDISFNQLSGAIPDSIALLSQRVTSFEGNSLCGKPLRVLCSVPSNPSNTTSIAPAMAVMPITEPSQGGSKKGMKISTIVIIIAADFSGIAIFAVVLFYLCHQRSRQPSFTIPQTHELEKQINISKPCEVKRVCCLKASEAESPRKGGALVMMDEEMELDIETLFKASAYIMGSNRSTIVYKAITADGRAFVVRRIGRNPEEKFTEFKNRIKFLAKLKHPNLVRVRGFYWGDEEKLIVFDLVHTSLSNLLSRASSFSNEARLKVAKGIAKGLAFLHDKKQVHGRLKPSNVLITCDFEAVISDFGVSSDSVEPGVTTESSLYRAPELVEKAKLNQKCDVFSFGVILLELLTGRVLSESEMGQWMDESADVSINRFGRLVEYGVRDEEESKKDLIRALKLGFKCVSVSPFERPFMKEVLLVLEKL